MAQPARCASPARRRRTGRRPGRARRLCPISARASRGDADRLAPVADHLDTVRRTSRSSRQSSRPPMSGPAHSCTATTPEAANASRAAVRAAARCAAVQQCAGRRPHPVMGVGGQRPRAVVAGGRCPARRPAPAARSTRARSARRRAPDRRVGRRATASSSAVVAAHPRSGQPRLIPAVPPDHAVGMRRGVFGEQGQEVLFGVGGRAGPGRYGPARWR